MLVLVHVSSTQMKPETSMRGCTRNHAARRLATSGRCCSAACSVFFEALAFVMHEGPDSLVVNLQALAFQFIGQALQGIVTCPHALEKPVAVLLDDLFRPVATHLGGRSASRPGMPRQPFDHS